MKKIVSVLLALLTAAALFSACGEKAPSAPEDISNTEDAAEEAAVSAPEQDEEPHYKQYDDPYTEAVCVYAESMLLRNEYVQYDDTRLMKDGGEWNYRWMRQKYACEDYTKQNTGYTNCAAFTYDCYFNALDYDIETWHTKDLYYTHQDRHVFAHENTGEETPEEKEKLEKEFRDALRPGDIIVYHKAGGVFGHAMLYVGDGEIIHSSAPGGGNYDYENREEKAEPRGSINRISVDSLFADKSANIWSRSRFAIVRPLKGYDKPIPEKTKSRVKNLQNMLVQKTSSRARGQTVNPGEEVTYKIEIKNLNKWAMSLEVTDFVPEYTSYVSGGDSFSGDTLKWSVTVPKGDTVKLEYKVKVNEDAQGKFIFTDKGSVGGVPVKCPGVYVATTLAGSELESMKNAAKAGGGLSVRGIELANKIYNDALGKALPFESFEDAVNGCFKEGDNGSGYYKLNPKGKYFNMIAPGLYGGYYVELTDEFEGVRTRGPRTINLIAGDIVIFSPDQKDEEIMAYLYNGENALLPLTGPGSDTLELMESRNALLGALGYSRFVILRPSMAF